MALIVGVAAVAGVGWLAVDSFGGSDGVDGDALMELGENEEAPDTADADDLSSETSVVEPPAADAVPDPLEPQPDLAGRSLFVAFENPLGAAIGSIWRLDLGSGTWTDTDFDGIPLAVVADDLLVIEEKAESIEIAAVPVDGSGDARQLTTDFAFVVDDRRQPAEEGTVWLFRPFDVYRFEYQRLDVATGEVLESFHAPRPDWRSIDAPSLLAAQGQIFARTDGEYRSVGPGRVVAAAPDLALVETCETPGDCAIEWRQGPDLEPVDRPVPDDLADARVTIIDDGSSLIYTTMEGSTWVFDVETGEARSLNTFIEFFSSMNHFVSHDQRYVALPIADPGPPREGAIVLVDLDDYETYNLGVLPARAVSVVWGTSDEAT